MFLTCGRVPSATTSTTMDYNGDFQAGYQEIDGISLGYLQINGTRMFALTQVLSDLFKDIPRAAVSKRMESLKIQSRRCDLRELRTLKAIQSVPMRAVKCSLISRSDLEALRTSCRALAARRRKRRRRKSKRRQPGGDLFQLSSAYSPSDVGVSCAKRGALLGSPFGGVHGRAAQPPKGYSRGCLDGLLGAYPGRTVGAHQPKSQPEPGRSTCGCLGKDKGASSTGSKRQGTSAGSSSDSDSSSPASSSESSEEEEEEDEEEEDSSCSSLDGSSSGSESSSLCSGDSVQSTRYRQAALPRLPAPPAPSPALPGAAKTLRPDASLFFWARTLRASAWESCKPGPKEEWGDPEPRLLQEPRDPPVQPRRPPARPTSPGEGPRLKHEESCVKELSRDPQSSRDPQLSKDAAASPGSREDVGEVGPEKAAGEAPAPEGSGREAHFDRLIRQSKLWCYAKGFNVDGCKGLRRGAEQARGSPKASLLSLPHKALKSHLERNPKRSQERPAKGKPPKVPKKATKKGSSPPCKRLLGPGPAPTSRNPFTLMGTFPCTPALVVGSDGDLCPASSLCVKDSCALSKTHPLWTWQLGGNAIPVPPSLKFRGYSLEDF